MNTSPRFQGLTVEYCQMSGTGSDGSGIEVGKAGNSTRGVVIRHNTIGDFGNNGIDIEDCGYITINDNQIGTDSAGANLRNDKSGIKIAACDADNDENEIYNNTIGFHLDNGIYVHGCDGLWIHDNYIGTDLPRARSGESRRRNPLCERQYNVPRRR